MSRPGSLSGVAAVLAAARTTTVGAPRGRRLLGLLFLVGIPLLIQVTLLIFHPGGRGQGFAAFARFAQFYLSMLTPLTLIFLGTATFGEEWAGGTSPYVVGLPVPRRALVLGRWLTCVRRSLTLLVPPLVIIYLLATLPLGVPFEYVGSLGVVVGVLALLMLAYAAIFILFGLVLRRALVVSLIYVFAIEGLASSLPQGLAQVSLAFHARNMMGQLTARAVGQDHFTLATTNLTGSEPPSVLASLTVLAVATAIALVLTTLMLRRKEAGGEVQAGDAAAT